jgi:phosphoserine phosphatase RsbU/P
VISARLQVSDASGSRVVIIDRDLFTIGRRSGHHLYLSGSDISRDHAVVERVGSQFTLRDRGSLCGTFVNGQPIDEHRLESGDRIHMGRTQGADLVFQVDPPNYTVPLTRPRGELHQIAALLEGLRALGSGAVLDEVLALVLDSAIRAAGAERGFVMLAGATQELEFTLGRGRNQSTLPGDSFKTSRRIPEAVFRTGEPEVVADLLEGDVAGAHSGTIALGIRQVLCVPLKVARSVDSPLTSEEPRRIGVLYLDSRDKGLLLSPETRMALEALAEEAALAIESARLYRESLERARLQQQMTIGAEIQQALLPESRFTGAGVDVACRSVPCLALGGDFIDYLPGPDGYFSFVLGDVSGKGLPAALLTAVLQGIFAVEATREGSPSQAVARANETLIHKDISPRYATMVQGVVAPDGMLQYTNAGHCAPVLITKSGIRRLGCGGTIVGIFSDAVYEEEPIRLQPGDLLVAYSDGLTEAFNSSWEEFGDERLLGVIQTNRHLPLDALLDAVLTAVRAFEGGTVQADDQSAFALRYIGRA